MQSPVALNSESTNSHDNEETSNLTSNQANAYQLITDAPIEYEERDDVIEDVTNETEKPSISDTRLENGEKLDSSNEKKGDTRVIRYGDRQDGKQHRSDHGRYYVRRDEHREETPTRLIHIRNLTRPYLLDDLMDLLSSCGKFARESIWQDKIKFRCFVEYEDEEMAKGAKNALNGMRWPPTNPRQLRVEYSDENELAAMKARDERMSERTDKMFNSSDITVSRRGDERLKVTRKYSVREWDAQKDEKSSPKIRKDGEGDDFEGERVKRREEKEGEKEAEKLLESLFRKTEAKPSVFWCVAFEEGTAEDVKVEDVRLRSPPKRASPERSRRSRSPRRRR